MSAVKLSPDEMFESLTGFDEIAIGKAFGSEWQDIAKDKPIMFLRALAFVQFRRDGKNDADAKKSALSLTVKDAQEFFEADTEEIDLETPETEQGKDDSAPE